VSSGHQQQYSAGDKSAAKNGRATKDPKRQKGDAHVEVATRGYQCREAIEAERFVPCDDERCLLREAARVDLLRVRQKGNDLQ